MIRLAEHLGSGIAEDVFTARILGSCKAGITDLVWSDGEGLLMGLNNGVLTVSGRPSDIEEFDEFIAMISPAAIICGIDLPVPQDYSEIQSGVIMSKDLSGKSEDIQADMDIRLRDYYRFFSESGLELEYEGFCIHMSRYMRSGTGFLESAFHGEEMTSAAAVSDITEAAAILNAVAVKPEYRRQGIASHLLDKIDRRLGSRRIFLFREHNENEEFYCNNGYTNTGLWKVLSLQSIRK